LPQPLEDEGGWAFRDVVARFAEYAGLVFEGLGDLVENWITHNEPRCTAFLGYGMGIKAPGRRDWPAALRASHHVLLSHGVVVQAFREAGRVGRIGISLDPTLVEPAGLAEEDVAAARRVDGHHNRWFLDPLLRGSYPADMLDWYEQRFGPLDAIREGDLETIAQPLDFLGVNFYTPHLVAADDGDPLLGARDVDPGVERTEMGWPVVPRALTELLLRVQRDYGDLPLFITENGAAYDDRLDGGDVVDDPGRVAYLHDHVAAVEKARAAGVDVRGYYVWSLLDNFEWAQGYGKRFGIVYVDYETQRRIPKRSALWYRDLIAARNGG
jgi:beta-glucosidase